MAETPSELLLHESPLRHTLEPRSIMRDASRVLVSNIAHRRTKTVSTESSIRSSTVTSAELTTLFLHGAALPLRWQSSQAPRVLVHIDSAPATSPEAHGTDKSVTIAGQRVAVVRSGRTPDSKLGPWDWTLGVADVVIDGLDCRVWISGYGLDARVVATCAIVDLEPYEHGRAEWIEQLRSAE